MHVCVCVLLIYIYIYMHAYICTRIHILLSHPFPLIIFTYIHKYTHIYTHTYITFSSILSRYLSALVYVVHVALLMLAADLHSLYVCMCVCV
jgi:hypothetical protein